MNAVKKTWLIDPDLVRQARRICGAKTETETVTMALRQMLIQEEIDQAFRKYGPVLADLKQDFSDGPPERKASPAPKTNARQSRR